MSMERDKQGNQYFFCLRVGLNEMVPDSLLSAFDEYELEVTCFVTNTLQPYIIFNLVIFWVNFLVANLSFNFFYILQLLMCGTGNISVTDFQNNHTVLHCLGPFRKVKVKLVFSWVVRALLQAMFYESQCLVWSAVIMVSRTNKLPKARENASDVMAVGFVLASYWLKGCMA